MTQDAKTSPSREPSEAIATVGDAMRPRANEVAPSIRREGAYVGNRKTLSL